MSYIAVKLIFKNKETHSNKLHSFVLAATKIEVFFWRCSSSDVRHKQFKNENAAHFLPWCTQAAPHTAADFSWRSQDSNVDWHPFGFQPFFPTHLHPSWKSGSIIYNSSLIQILQQHTLPSFLHLECLEGSSNYREFWSSGFCFDHTLSDHRGLCISASEQNGWD